MDLEIVYHIQDARQFWAELEDICQVSASTTLSQLDASLRNFITVCAMYHEQYLQTPVQLEHACSLLLDSEIFLFHSDRLTSLVMSDALTNTDPHAQLIMHYLLLLHGRRHPPFLRSPKKWSELIPLLMDHILLVDIDTSWHDSGIANTWRGGISVPIETRLRTLSVRILYEVCRVQKFDAPALRVFTEVFIDYLFELVEATRDMMDETLNYCVVKLIIALNEQFMVSALQQHKDDSKDVKAAQNADNRVIQVLMRRLGSSKTFGENLIFMLNRADKSPEDRCMQLLVLKILYLLFTTPGTQEYFYTNDLCVLVDVFIRELGDLDEEHESLRHTYLRVLHPLLTHTQLRTIQYKRSQTLRMLESLVAHAAIRDVNPTTKRLVERCLSADWAVHLIKEREAAKSAHTHNAHSAETKSQLLTPVTHAHPLRDLKFSKSVEVLVPANAEQRKARRPTSGKLQSVPLRKSNESSLSLLSLADAGSSLVDHIQVHVSTSPKETRLHSDPSTSPKETRLHLDLSSHTVEAAEVPRLSDAPTQDTDPQRQLQSPPRRYRPAPAPPSKRRMPPAVPSRSTKAVFVSKGTTAIIASQKRMNPTVVQ